MPHQSVTQEQILRKVQEVLAKQQNVKVAAIQPSARLQEDLGIDSFGAIELMFEFEDAFKVVIPNEDMLHLKTVEDVVNYVLNQIVKSQHAGLDGSGKPLAPSKLDAGVSPYEDH